MFWSLIVLTTIAKVPLRQLTSHGKVFEDTKKSLRSLKEKGELSTVVKPEQQQINKIISGPTVSASEFPSALAILVCVEDQLFDAGGGKEHSCQQLCTGTLVAPNVVLTAAHCIWDQEADEEIVQSSVYFVTFVNDWVNTAFSTSNGKFIGVSSMHVHPDYKGNYDVIADDVGILVLDSCVTDVTPSKIDTPDTDYDDAGKTGDVLGYGLTDASIFFDGVPSPLRKKKNPSTIASFDQCVHAIGSFLELRQFNLDGTQVNVTADEVLAEHFLTDDRVICHGTFSGSLSYTCSGDSGGPMISREDDKDTVIGVNSFVLTPCSTFPLDFATRVSRYAKFLHDLIVDENVLATCSYDIEDVFATFPVPNPPTASDYDDDTFSCTVTDSTAACRNDDGSRVCFDRTDFCDGNAECDNGFDESRGDAGGFCSNFADGLGCEDAFDAARSELNKCKSALNKVIEATSVSSVLSKCLTYIQCFTSLNIPDFDTVSTCSDVADDSFDSDLDYSDFFGSFGGCFQELVLEKSKTEKWGEQIRTCMLDETELCLTEDNTSLQTDESVTSSSSSLTVGLAMFFSVIAVFNMIF